MSAINFKKAATLVLLASTTTGLLMGPAIGMPNDPERSISPITEQTQPPQQPLNRTLVQQEEEEAARRVRPGGGRIARFLWCRFGPEGGSRDSCANQANQ